MKIIGINWEQNSTASLWVNGQLLGCRSEERCSRIKNDERYPKQAIDWLLEENNLAPDQIDKIVFVSNLWSYGHILTRHYTAFTVKDYVDEQYKIWRPRLLEGRNVSQVEVYKDRLDLSQFPGSEFWEEQLSKFPHETGHASSSNASEVGRIRAEVASRHLGLPLSKIHFADHSSSHAAYAYYCSPKSVREKPALVLTLDAFGDNVNYSASLYSSSTNGSHQKRTLSEGNSLIIGRLYRYITLILGLKPNEHEYKVMGMAPYCKDQYSERLFELFKTFQHVEGFDFVYANKPSDMYFAIRDMLEGERFDSICGALQRYAEWLLTRWISNIVDSIGPVNVVMAGGVAMNVKANMLVAKLPGVANLYVPPSPDDSSQAMGAALEFMRSSACKSEILSTFTPYLGYKADYSLTSDCQLLSDAFPAQDYQITRYCEGEVADLIAGGAVIARCTGKEEFGARALGNRSILADPRSESVKKLINEKIKNRDFWMPFACSVIDEYASEYFHLDSSPDSYQYMTLCCETTETGAALLQAAIHPYDGTCRPQLVSKDSNRDYYSLIAAFGRRTGVYALLNTSFNLHGLPIVSTVQDAQHVMENSSLDALILGDVLVKRVRIL